MNYDLLKSKMDSFFHETSPEEIVKDFEKMGYEFVELPIIPWTFLPYNQISAYTTILESGRKKWRFWEKWENISCTKLTSEYPGSFFLCRIVI